MAMILQGSWWDNTNQQTPKHLSNRSSSAELCPTVPGSKRALMSSKISATRMAKDRLAWMWYRWLRMVLTELQRGGETRTYQHRQMKCDGAKILTTRQQRWPEWWRGRRWKWSSRHIQWWSAPPCGQQWAMQRDRQQHLVRQSQFSQLQQWPE